MIPATPYNENELFLQISRGDQQAFRLLFDLYRQRLFAFAWQLCHSAVDAEEIVQDVFLRLWEQREKLPDVDMPRKYIYTMTRNRTLDVLGKIAKDQRMVRQMWATMRQSDNDTEQLLYAEDSRKLIQLALSRLSEKKRTVFTLSRHEGLSHQDIAARLGLSVQTVKNIMTEVLKHIQYFLSQNAEILSIVFLLQTASRGL